MLPCPVFRDSPALLLCRAPLRCVSYFTLSCGFHRNLIITLAVRHKLPAVYFDRYFVATGGLVSYGPDSTNTSAPPATSTASSRARSLLIFRYKRR